MGVTVSGLMARAMAAMRAGISVQPLMRRKDRSVRLGGGPQERSATIGSPRTARGEGCHVGNFGDWQFSIYLDGLTGTQPSFPMTFAEWERKAEATMSPELWLFEADRLAVTQL